MQTHPQVAPGSTNNKYKIGILSAGKMGSSIARTLSEKGTFYTFLDGRSPKTIENAKRCNIQAVSCLEELFDNIDIFICIGTSGIAKDSLQLAVKYEYKNIYLDLNTLFGRESEQELYRISENKSFHYVDGTIYGWPPNVDEKEINLNKTKILLFNDINNVIYNLFKGDYWDPSVVTTPAKTYRRLNLS